MNEPLWSDDRIATELAEIMAHQMEGKSPPRYDDELLYKMRDEYEAGLELVHGLAEAKIAQLEAQKGAWEPVPDGDYIIHEDTDDENRWEISDGGRSLKITDCVEDWVHVDMPDGWQLMRRVEAQHEAAQHAHP